MADLCADWAKNGAAVIARVRIKNPAAYLRTVVSLLPRDFPDHIETDYAHMSDAELIARMRKNAAILERAASEDQAAETTLRKTRPR